jgi:hypothetical protein
MVGPLTPLSPIRAALERGPDQRERAIVDTADRTEALSQRKGPLDVRPLSPANIARLFLPPFGLLREKRPPGGTAKARSVRIGDELLVDSDGPAYELSRLPQAARTLRSSPLPTTALLEEREERASSTLLQRVRERSAAHAYRDERPRLAAQPLPEALRPGSVFSATATRAYEQSAQALSGASIGWPAPSLGVPVPQKSPMAK